MKSMKEIEKMNLEELLEVSSDESVRVPDGFMDRMNDELGAVMMVSALTDDEDSSSIPRTTAGASADRDPFRKRFVRFVSAAAAVAALACIGLSLIENEPEDTFDDPYLAYAELEKAFATISGGINKGVEMAGESQKIIEKTSKVFE